MNFDIGRQPMRLQLRDGGAAPQKLLLVAIAYYLGAEAAFLIGTLSDRIFAPFWPPNVVLFCALLVVPQRQWWLYIAAVFPAHVVAELGVGMPMPQLLVAFATNCLVALLNAVAVRRLVGGPPWLGDLRKACLYVLVTAMASPAVSALGGAFVPIMGGGAIEQYWTFWGYWYVANALANLALGPIFLSWSGDGMKSWVGLRYRHRIEAIVLACALIALSLLAFELSSIAALSGFLPAILYAPLPLVLWAAFRFGAKGASAAILIVTVVLVSHSLRGSSMFVGADPETSVLSLQLFLTGLAIPTLLLGALTDELRRAELTMRELAGSVLRSQDDERRRIARELHDSISQNLAAASLTAARLHAGSSDKTEALVEQLERGLQQSIGALRSLSYVLHPPLLDEAGLALALRAYLSGHAERSGLHVDVDIAPDLERLPAEAELVLFRVVQEILSDDSPRRSKDKADVRLWRESLPAGQNVVLTIETVDKGTGDGPPATETDGATASHRDISAALAGLRERLRKIGGHLDIRPGSGRTIVAARVPVSSAARMS